MCANIAPAVSDTLEPIRPPREESPASSSAGPSLDNLRPPNSRPPKSGLFYEPPEHAAEPIVVPLGGLGTGPMAPSAAESSTDVPISKTKYKPPGLREALPKLHQPGFTKTEASKTAYVPPSLRRGSECSNPTPPPQDIQAFPTATRPPQSATPQEVPLPAFQPTRPPQATSSQDVPPTPFQSAKASPTVPPTREFFSRPPQDATLPPSQPAPSFTPQPTPSVTPARYAKGHKRFPAYF